MEISATPPLARATQPGPVQPQAPGLAARGTPVRAETSRPVMEPAAPILPAPIEGLGIPPLNTEMVGDNDEVPEEGDLPTEQVTDATADDTVDAEAIPDPELPTLLREIDETVDPSTLDVRR